MLSTVTAECAKCGETAFKSTDDKYTMVCKICGTLHDLQQYMGVPSDYSKIAMGGNNHSKEELEAMIVNMRKASEVFYWPAFHIGCHPFIEFTGLLNDYIDACRDALKDGIDFTMCNQHTGMKLPLKDYQRNYLNEKLACIFIGEVGLKPE